MAERGLAQVLLVEDNPADVRLFSEALSRHAAGVQLHVVGNGDDALQFVRREGTFNSVPAPDLIVLNLNLPGKDGREILRELKSDPALQRIPVVVLTAASSDKATSATARRRMSASSARDGRSSTPGRASRRR